jgi:cytochrome P450
MISDLTITSQNGQSYLLKRGIDVQVPAGVPHAQPSIWGLDAGSFNAERFLPSSNKTTHADRAHKAAYIPFGGGRHLCPGRNFAFTEIIGFAAVLLLGFEIEARGMEFRDMQMQVSKLASGTVKPVKNGEGFGARFRIREGWDGVSWSFED